MLLADTENFKILEDPFSSLNIAPENLVELLDLNRRKKNLNSLTRIAMRICVTIMRFVWVTLSYCLTYLYQSGTRMKIHNRTDPDW